MKKQKEPKENYTYIFRAKGPSLEMEETISGEFGKCQSRINRLAQAARLGHRGFIKRELRRRKRETRLFNSPLTTMQYQELLRNSEDRKRLSVSIERVI